MQPFLIKIILILGLALPFAAHAGVSVSPTGAANYSMADSSASGCLMGLEIRKGRRPDMDGSVSISFGAIGNKAPNISRYNFTSEVIKPFPWTINEPLSLTFEVSGKGELYVS